MNVSRRRLALSVAGILAAAVLLSCSPKRDVYGVIGTSQPLVVPGSEMANTFTLDTSTFGFQQALDQGKDLNSAGFRRFSDQTAISGSLSADLLRLQQLNQAMMNQQEVKPDMLTAPDLPSGKPGLQLPQNFQGSALGSPTVAIPVGDRPFDAVSNAMFARFMGDIPRVLAAKKSTHDIYFIVGTVTIIPGFRTRKDGIAEIEVYYSVGYEERLATPTPTPTSTAAPTTIPTITPTPTPTPTPGWMRPLVFGGVELQPTPSPTPFPTTTPFPTITTLPTITPLPTPTVVATHYPFSEPCMHPGSYIPPTPTPTPAPTIVPKAESTPKCRTTWEKLWGLNKAPQVPAQTRLAETIPEPLIIPIYPIRRAVNEGDDAASLDSLSLFLQAMAAYGPAQASGSYERSLQDMARLVSARQAVTFTGSMIDADTQLLQYRSSRAADPFGEQRPSGARILEPTVLPIITMVAVPKKEKENRPLKLVQRFETRWHYRRPAWSLNRLRSDWGKTGWERDVNLGTENRIFDGSLNPTMVREMTLPPRTPAPPVTQEITRIVAAINNDHPGVVTVRDSNAQAILFVIEGSEPEEVLIDGVQVQFEVVGGFAKQPTWKTIRAVLTAEYLEGLAYRNGVQVGARTPTLTPPPTPSHNVEEVTVRTQVDHHANLVTRNKNGTSCNALPVFFSYDVTVPRSVIRKTGTPRVEIDVPPGQPLTEGAIRAVMSGS